MPIIGKNGYILYILSNINYYWKKLARKIGMEVKRKYKRGQEKLELWKELISVRNIHKHIECTHSITNLNTASINQHNVSKNVEAPSSKHQVQENPQ